MKLVRGRRRALGAGLVGFGAAAAAPVLAVASLASHPPEVSSQLADPSGHRSKIVFTKAVRSRAPRHRPSIAVMRPDGSHRHILIHDGSEPAFSPDATKIAFYRQRHSNQDIYVMRANGTDVRRLTRNRAPDTGPAFSPDGAKIAYTSRRDGQAEIYVMRADGTHERRLTHDPYFQAGPDYSPRGTRIAFTHRRDGKFDVYKMRADGTHWRRLTDHPGIDNAPDFAPNGKKIAFARGTTSHSIDAIWTMGTGGRHQRRLTENQFLTFAPVYSPGGKRIAFNVNAAIYKMNADGTRQRRLTKPGAESTLPDWGRR